MRRCFIDDFKLYRSGRQVRIRYHWMHMLSAIMSHFQAHTSFVIVPCLLSPRERLPRLTAVSTLDYADIDPVGMDSSMCRCSMPSIRRIKNSTASSHRHMQFIRSLACILGCCPRFCYCSRIMDRHGVCLRRPYAGGVAT